MEPDCPGQEALLERLQRIPGFATLVLSVHQKPGNAVLGNTFHTLYGPGWIEDTLCGLTFRLSPRSFYQVNHDQAERLYDCHRWRRVQKTDVVLDLYCGVGTITLAMAKAAGRVIGVEVEPQAVADAQDNARRNGVQNAEFFCGDAGQARPVPPGAGPHPGRGGGRPTPQRPQPRRDSSPSPNVPPQNCLHLLRSSHIGPGCGAA